VRLEIFDLQGRRVVVLVDRIEEAGGHAAWWDGRGSSGGLAAPGVYFARLDAGGEERATKVVLMRRP
jgi:hypothetical protein